MQSDTRASQPDGGIATVTGSQGNIAPEQRLALRHDPGAVREARQFVGALLREREAPDEAVDRAVLVSSAPDDQTRGWGLQIVDQLALQWGVFEGTTHVWADLGLL